MGMRQTVKKVSITFLARLLFFGQEWTKIKEDASAGEAVMAAMAAMASIKDGSGNLAASRPSVDGAQHKLGHGRGVAVVVAATADVAVVSATADVAVLAATADMVVAVAAVNVTLVANVVGAAVAVIGALVVDVAVMKDVAMQWARSCLVAVCCLSTRQYQALFLGRHKPQLGGKHPLVTSDPASEDTSDDAAGGKFASLLQIRWLDTQFQNAVEHVSVGCVQSGVENYKELTRLKDNPTGKG
uniref:Uncharacterized protein n=1 Tax=Phytophthora ramorum TaxID=164328 RepID=H3GRR2_PHYRM